MSSQHTVLRKLRLSQPEKLTQKDVAEGAGISQGNYSKKEKGDISITLQDLEKLAKFYGVPTWQILQGNTTNSHDPEPENDNGNGEMMKRIIELTDVIVSLNKMIDKKDTEIEKLKKEIERGK